jgi:hypothetical protein
MVLRTASPATLDRQLPYLVQRLRAARLSEDHGRPAFEEAMLRGHRYYQTNFFTGEGAPKYFHNRTFPIDIHACSQAILHFVAFSSIDPNALERASRTFQWTMRNMAAPDGSFYYQRHRLWTNRAPYMRWGQAWMLRALAKLLRSSASPLGLS